VQTLCVVLSLSRTGSVEQSMTGGGQVELCSIVCIEANADTCFTVVVAAMQAMSGDDSSWH
jgi:hypothetical protein